MPKTNILFLGYQPPPYGGLETVTQSILGSELLKREFNIIFFRIQTVSQTKDRGKFGFNNIFINLKNIVRYVGVILKGKTDLVYCPLAQNPVGFIRDSLFIVIARIFRKKTVVHFHGGNFDFFYNRQPAFFKFYIRLVFKGIGRLIVLGDCIRRQFTGLISDRNILVIYNCVNPDDLKMGLNVQRTSSGGVVNVLFVGYISKAKGAVDVVKAAAIIAKQCNITVKWRLIGKVIDEERNVSFVNDPHGAYGQITQLIKENGLAGLVEVCTDTDQEFKIKSFQDADIFVFPSYSEGFGIVVLEAMASGLPVVMSKIGGLSEVLQEKANAFFITPGDYKGLAEKVKVLINDPGLRAQMGRNNRRLAVDKFSRDNFYIGLKNAWSV